jgi:tetratricopeptide (TPR) repeat protein
VSSVGVAMIARNAVGDMPEALAPFMDHIDDLAIVLGGRSADDTESVACLLTDKVSHYLSSLDDDGSLLDFAEARQQSFDALETDWAAVVDSDDRWQEVGRLRPLLQLADQDGADWISVPYRVQGLEMRQLRIYRREAGRWEMPVHEYFQMNGDAHGLKTNWLGVSQVERDKKASLARVGQNIRIAERWLVEHGDDFHVLCHLAKDYASAGEYEESLETADRYFALYHATEEHERKQELSSVLYHQAGIALMTKRYDLALPAVLTALNVYEDGRDCGPVWALLAELCQQIGGDKAALNELAVFAADKALTSGRTRNGYARDNTMSLTGALCVKAEALEVLGRLAEARGALDLGLMIDPGHVQMLRVLQRVSETLEELP